MLKVVSSAPFFPLEIPQIGQKIRISGSILPKITVEGFIATRISSGRNIWFIYLSETGSQIVITNIHFTGQGWLGNIYGKEQAISVEIID